VRAETADQSGFQREPANEVSAVRRSNNFVLINFQRSVQILQQQNKEPSLSFLGVASFRGDLSALPLKS